MVTATDPFGGASARIWFQRATGRIGPEGRTMYGTDQLDTVIVCKGTVIGTVIGLCGPAAVRS